LQIAGTKEFDEPVAQILAFDQHENNEDHHNARCCERRDKRTED
jgi:hypothetical protein